MLRLGADAREAELKAVVSPRVLHLATHGFFLSDQEFKRTNSLPSVWSSAFTRPGPPEGGTPNDWENPLVRCGIALAGANHARQITNAVAEDGLLTGLEASLLNLQGTELVILSACDSGTGEVKIGEGVMSLRRAFRIAGAETVLASHWPVSDKATSRLMTEFMRRWRAGEPRAKAWREAQLSLLRSKDFSNPYFWAAFTLTGQWSMILLQRLHRVTAFLERGDAERGGLGAAQRGHDRRVGINGRGADFHFVGARRLAGGRVDDELDFPVLQKVNRVGPAFGQFENALNFQPGLLQTAAVPLVATNSKPRSANCFATPRLPFCARR